MTASRKSTSGLTRRQALAFGAAALATPFIIRGARAAGDFRILTRRRTLPVPTQTAKTLFQVGRELLRPEIGRTAYRLIGIGLADLLEAGDAPDDLFAQTETRARKSETAVDALRAKFGMESIRSGRALTNQPRKR